MRKNLLKKSAAFAAIAITLFSNGAMITTFADSPEPETYATTLISKAFSGKNNIISGAKYTSGFHSYTTTSSQGKFSCRLTERYAGSSPDKVIASHTGSKYSSRYLSGGTYYIRYEGNSHDAKTYAKLEK